MVVVSAYVCICVEDDCGGWKRMCVCVCVGDGSVWYILVIKFSKNFIYISSCFYFLSNRCSKMR